MMFIILISVLIPVVVIAIIVADRVIYGRTMTSDEVDDLMDKLDNRPCIYSDRTIHFWYYDFISRKPGFGLLPRWYMYFYGIQKRISRKSVINRLLDQKANYLKSIESMKTVELKPA